MRNDKQHDSGSGKRRLLDSAVIATLVGALLTGSFGLIQKWQHSFEEKEREKARIIEKQIEEDRHKERWEIEKLRNSQEKSDRENRIMFERILTLQNLYSSVKSGDDLLRLDKSLDWMENNSGDKRTKDLIASFRKELLKEDLENQLSMENIKEKMPDQQKAQIESTLAELKKLEEKEIRRKEKEASDAKVKAESDKLIKPIDLQFTKSKTKESRKLLVLNELICIDPQSNWPKKCDQIYLKVDGEYLWGDPRRMCRGDRISLNDKIYFDDQTKIELWEYDRIEDDLLGVFKVIDNLKNNYGRVFIGNSDEKGDWNYTFTFEVAKEYRRQPQRRVQSR